MDEPTSLLLISKAHIGERSTMDSNVSFIFATIVITLAILSSSSASFVIEQNATHLSVSLDGIRLVDHDPTAPFLFVGSGLSTTESHYGNYRLRDYVEARVPLFEISGEGTTSADGATVTSVTFSDDCKLSVTVRFVSDNGKNFMEFDEPESLINRMWIRLYAEADEKVYGGGEQFTYFNMRGRNFPLWVQEQGVGRNKSSLITLLSNQNDGGGGDYYTTYWAQPTFLSSRKYYAHFTTTAYSELDFRSSSYHEFYVWGRTPGTVHFFTGTSYIDLVQQLTEYQGRQPPMPDWVYNGVVLGLQGGTERMLQYYNLAKENGIKVSGLWIQDWAGRIKTSFGRRIFWNWEWNREHYPNLDQEITRLNEEGVKVLVYANLNLNREGNLFQEAEELGNLVLDKSGNTYIVDYGEFFCGIVDITNPKAAQWYKDRVIKQNMIELGVGGWMADFGEYLPTDAVFHNGQSGMELHNEWPTLWARVNREAVEEAGKLGEILYWMRAGFTGSQKYGVMTWAGDQFVDFSLSDGLASVIPAALSLGISGFGLFHFDLGGFTSLFDYTRSEELFFRYGEIAAFTSMMRTHEGNRPDQNVQFYSNKRMLSNLACHTKIYLALNKYRRVIILENSDWGVPTQRPLFMHYEDDAASYDVQYEYMFGRDLLVAPVYEAGRQSWDVYLPPDNWVFLWDEAVTSGGGETITVPAPIGKIPVFFRRDSRWADDFRKVRDIDEYATDGFCVKEDKDCQKSENAIP